MGNSESGIKVLRMIRHELMNALLKLDEKGTNETVSKAMSIVSTGFESAIEGKNWTGDDLFIIGIERAATSF